MGVQMNRGRIEFLEARARLAMEALTKELLRQERFAWVGDVKNGTVLKWDQVYERNGKSYSFSAVKIVGKWYTSKLGQTTPLSDDEFVEFYLAKAVEGTIKKAKSWENIG